MGFFRGRHTITAWQHERIQMVEEQLKARGIYDPKVLAAMETVPRELFIPEEYRKSAYRDGPLPIGDGQTISQPYMVALMTQCLKLTGTERVLEIGTGSGYQMAVLLEISPQVCSVERLPSVAHRAIENLTKLGHENLYIKVDDGTCGWHEEAPFDGIIVTAGAQEIPAALKEQLADGGRLIIPVGTRYSQMLYRITRRGKQFQEEEFTACVFVPLIGLYGWKDNS